MREILRTNDPVLLSFAQSVLAAIGIAAMIADQHISIIEGSIGIFPRRLLVHGDDAMRARGELIAAGLEAALLPEGNPGPAT